MLLGIDEYPFHQIAQPFAAAATSDAQWNDGHYICVSDAEGKVCFAATLRLYHNNDVLDGFVCLRHQDRQHNIRLSRRLRPRWTARCRAASTRDRRAAPSGPARPGAERLRH